MTERTKYHFCKIFFLGIGMTLLPQPQLNVFAYSGGTGNGGDPYLISTPEDLIELAKDANASDNAEGKYYKLVNDIDLAGFDTDNDPSNGNWVPIAQSVRYGFKGTFDGDGHVIKNMVINLPEAGNVGLFGQVYTGVVQNVGVENAYVVGNHNVGALIGELASSTAKSAQVSNVYSTGYVEGRSVGVGGLIGKLWNSSQLINAYSLATVVGDSEVGGLIGQAVNTGYTLRYVYAAGSVTGNERTGGLVGYRNQYSVPQSAFYVVETTGQTSSALGSGIRLEEILGEAAKDNLYYFNFDNVWKTTEGFPVLQWESERESVIKPIIEANDIKIAVGDVFDSSLYASAKDEFGRPLKIEVVSDTVKSGVEGNYSVTYRAYNQYGYFSEKTIQVIVVKNEAPILEADNLRWPQGEPFLAENHIKVFDDFDQDLIVEVVKNEVTPEATGEYEVTYRVEDQHGLVTEKTIIVTVFAKPVIQANNLKTSLGQDIDLLENVTAVDENGQVLEVKILTTTLDLENPGIYEVTYEAKDAFGYQVSETVEIEVLPHFYIPTESTKPEIVDGNTPFDIKDYITSRPGWSSEWILEILNNPIIPGQEGIYEITYEITTGNGAKIQEIIQVEIQTSKPSKPTSPGSNSGNENGGLGGTAEIVGSFMGSILNPEIERGSSFDLENFIMSQPGWNPEWQIGNIKNPVNPNDTGNYKVTFDIITADGNKYPQEMQVEVMPSSNTSTDKDQGAMLPMVLIPNKVVTELGVAFDPIEYITSLPDWNSDWKVEVLEDCVNPSKPGIYEVIYRITTEDGLVFEQLIEIAVEGSSTMKDDEKEIVETGVASLSILVAGISMLGIGWVVNRTQKKL